MQGAVMMPDGLRAQAAALAVPAGAVLLQAVIETLDVRRPELLQPDPAEGLTDPSGCRRVPVVSPALPVLADVIQPLVEQVGNGHVGGGGYGGAADGLLLHLPEHPLGVAFRAAHRPLPA